MSVNSLGFDKPPAKTRVAVAMSGGVDSSTVAALLAKEGYDIVGLTFKLYKKPDETGRSCCTSSDLDDVKSIAAEYKFEHHVLDFEEIFARAVIDDFVADYVQGRTPIPCAICNAKIKFGAMLTAALDRGAECLVTGHYVQTRLGPKGGVELHRGIDPTKDQSYFLFAVPPERLAQARFPLGGWTKTRTREEARRLGLITAEKSESQDICFVSSGDYTQIVADRSFPVPGAIEDESGRVVGHHLGIMHYTIGQRRGLGIGGGMGQEEGGAFYVTRIDAQRNTIIVGPKSALARRMIIITNCTWMTEKEIDGPVLLQFRSTMAPIEATLERTKNAAARLYLAKEQYGVAPGQAAVCYDGTRVLGGGIIAASV